MQNAVALQKMHQNHYRLNLCFATYEAIQYTQVLFLRYNGRIHRYLA